MPTQIGNFIAQNFRSTRPADVERDRYSNTLLQNQVDRLPQMNKAQDLEIQAAEQNMGQSRMAGARKMAADMLAAVADSPDPIGMGATLFRSPMFREAGAAAGLPVDQFAPGPGDDPEKIRAAARAWAQAVGAQGAAQQTRVHSTFVGKDGNQWYLTADGQAVNTGIKASQFAQRPVEAAGALVPFDPSSGRAGAPIATAPEQVQAAANLKRAETEAAASVTPADTRAAANAKAPRLAAAERRLQRVAAASQALGSGGGPLEGRIRNMVGTPAAQELEAANAQLINELTALTRIPGVGSQSDLEQRLAQLQLPNATQHPSVRERSIQELSAFLTDLGAALNSAGGAPASNGGWTIQEVK